MNRRHLFSRGVLYFGLVANILAKKLNIYFVSEADKFPEIFEINWSVRDDQYRYTTICLVRTECR